MRRMLFVVLVPLTLLLLAAVPLFTLYPRQVRVVVRDELDGEPISLASITSAERSFSSDSAGRYDLGWLRGAPTLTVTMDGYLPTQTTIPKGEFPGQTVHFPVVLTPNTLSGFVRDAETEGTLPGSTIIFGDLSIAADEWGGYSLRRVTAGMVLTVSMPGYEALTVQFDGRETQDFRMQPTETRVVVSDLYSGKPVPGSALVHGSTEVKTDMEGVAVIKRLLRDAVLSVQAVGYAGTESVFDGGDTISVTLRPNTLRGMIADKDDGMPLAGVTVRAIVNGEVLTSTVTDDSGRYLLDALPSTFNLVVTAAAYDRFEAFVDAITEIDVNLGKSEVRGIYMPLGLLTSMRRVQELVDLVNDTELNTIVVDMKNDRGWLAYPSDLPEAKRSRAYQPNVMDVHEFLALCREKGIYTIARIVLFKDPSLAAAYPEWAVQTQNGEVWIDTEGSAWGDPFRTEVQDYLIAIAKEVAQLGFDELQFDYIRFPSDGSVGQTRYIEESTLESRCKTIREFCARLRHELGSYGVILSADLFGLTAWVDPEKDMGIGQRVIDIAPYMDYLSPMLYPATFSSGNLGYENPLLYPYEIVYRSCVELAKRTKTRVRPWLQHYSRSGVEYGTEELRSEKQAAEDAKANGWMFWNAAGRYNAQVFDPVPEAEQQ